MFKLSKNKEIIKLNGREYRTNKWSTITTMLEGKKLILAIAPSFSTMADLKLSSHSKEPTLDELVDGADTDFIFTAAISQLTSNFTDDHFVDLLEKLLSNFEVRETDEDGNVGDWVKIEDWSAHFDTYPEDFETLVIKSAKVNLYDFFMKQATVRSTLEKVTEVASPLLTKLKNDLKEGMS